ncbi:MAG: hypothetical protein ACOYZ7_07850 [Chloroflexota bacterium]
MREHLRSMLASLGFYGLWAAVALLAALAAHQLYATLLFIGLLIVQNPRTRPSGWNTMTLYGLSRFLVLVLGICWLLAVYLAEGYLREGLHQHRLKSRLLRLGLGIGMFYGASYGLLTLLSR